MVHKSEAANRKEAENPLQLAYFELGGLQASARGANL